MKYGKTYMPVQVVYECSLCGQTTILSKKISYSSYAKFKGPDNIQCAHPECDGIAIRFKPPSNHGNILAMDVNANPNPYSDGKYNYG